MSTESDNRGYSNIKRRDILVIFKIVHKINTRLRWNRKGCKSLRSADIAAAQNAIKSTNSIQNISI
jgi:hypothetical protein